MTFMPQELLVHLKSAISDENMFSFRRAWCLVIYSPSRSCQPKSNSHIFRSDPLKITMRGNTKRKIVISFINRFCLEIETLKKDNTGILSGVGCFITFRLFRWLIRKCGNNSNNLIDGRLRCHVGFGGDCLTGFVYIWSYPDNLICSRIIKNCLFCM